MRAQTKLALGVALVAVAALVAALLNGRGDDSQDTVVSAEERSTLLPDDAHVLGEPGTSDVTLVEFLDFECEGCLAAYPVVEQLRRKYAGKITFVVRYFPLPSHPNSERAARAVEAAARQGKFEQMYSTMYQTQTSWGHHPAPQDDVFRSFAADLGLDLERFDEDYSSRDVADRVRRDVEDGVALGVTGTPTFFLDDQLITPASAEDFEQQLEAALAQ